jgi:transcriptional regulator with XRE-family HTH domain
VRSEGEIVGSRPARHRYCRCGTHLAADNPGRQRARCQRASRDKLIAPPHVPPEFWQTEQFDDAFAAQHIGRVARAYRMHPYHHTVYGPSGISQTLLGQWLGLRQPQISRIETGPPIPNMDTLVYWARILRIPAELLWFKLPDDKSQLATGEPPSPGAPPAPDTNDEHADDPERNPVLIAPWNHQGTVEVAVVLSGGDGRAKRRVFLSLTGPALTASAHQWLVHESGPLVSGLAGRRVASGLVDQFSAMVADLRRMDDAAGGGSVLTMSQQAFAWVTGCSTERRMTSAPARRCMWCSPSWDSCVASQPGMPETTGWRSTTTSPPCALPTVPMTGYLAPTSSRPWPAMPPAKGSQPRG